ncbi:hypothetical protein ACFY8W_12955 [Streptomyces sp. NPDC012637]|uniref:hypothetical protein n=1 Tax=unclassified Streptomyces TaxID=2593676 RepID=UPI0036E2A7BC
MHHTETTESGSFAFARCSCGWRGPARRSRDRARMDAEGHTEEMRGVGRAS